MPSFRLSPSGLTTPAYTGIYADRRPVNVRLREAFTPTHPKRTRDLFAGRLQLIERVISAIEEDQSNVVIFGPRGVGKTSLANVVSASAKQGDYHVLRCTCSSDITFEKMFRGFLREIPGEFTRWAVGAPARRTNNFEELLPRGDFGPSELSNVLSYLERAHFILIIDEFDRVASGRLKLQLAETIKNLSDMAANVTFMILGIAQDLEGLIGKHPSIQRSIVGIHLSLMQRSSLRTLIGLGEEAAGIRFEDKVREKIITFCKGLPYYAQLICLHAARHAVDRGSSTVCVEDLRNALDQILAEADPLVAAMYERATRGGRMQFMQDVLFAAAWCPFDPHGGFTAADASAVLLDAGGGPRLPELTLHRAYSALAEKRSGPMLEKRITPAGETRYRFSNQTMCQYILVRQAQLRGLF